MREKGWKGGWRWSERKCGDGGGGGGVGDRESDWEGEGVGMLKKGKAGNGRFKIYLGEPLRGAGGGGEECLVPLRHLWCRTIASCFSKIF